MLRNNVRFDPIQTAQVAQLNDKLYRHDNNIVDGRYIQKPQLLKIQHLQPKVIQNTPDARLPFYKGAVQKKDFGQFADLAYKSKRGYHLRTNPITGESEMFVAGTRNARDWAANVTDTLKHNTPFLKRLPPFQYRRKYTDMLSDVAKKNRVKRVYGHSRGAALVSDMKGPYERVGLDGAMLMATDRNMVNLTASGRFGSSPATAAFDGLIGLGGQQNISTPAQSFHSVYNKRKF
jgi:hypothetical protein